MGKHKHKRTPEQRERIRQAALNRDPSTYLRGEDHQNFRIDKNRKCIDCGVSFTHRTERQRCLACYRAQNNGENHPAWTGGKPSFVKRLRGLVKYHNWKQDVLERDNHTCQECGTEENIEVHHKKEMKQMVKEFEITTIKQAKECDALWDINNGQSLCVHCHAEEHPDQRNLILRRAI
jgi:hypothetical protein